jgi:hypothetical protein
MAKRALLFAAVLLALGASEAGAYEAHITVGPKVSTWESARTFPDGSPVAVSVYVRGRPLSIVIGKQHCRASYAGRGVLGSLNMCNLGRTRIRFRFIALRQTRLLIRYGY